MASSCSVQVRLLGIGDTLWRLPTKPIPVRLVGGALYVAADSPKDSILTGALILESLGSQLLLVQLTKLLVG